MFTNVLYRITFWRDLHKNKNTSTINHSIDMFTCTDKLLPLYLCVKMGDMK